MGNCKCSYVEPAKVLMLGLDKAGKTTILYKLRLNEVVTTIPTIGFNMETVKAPKRMTFTVWDIGGQDKIRSLWRNYFWDTQGIFFVVDSADRERFEVARDLLLRILDEDEKREVPVVVLANKQDLPGAADAPEMTDLLGLHSVRHRQWSIQALCATTGDGLPEGMEMMAVFPKSARKS